jgi:hypothetical protein
LELAILGAEIEIVDFVGARQTTRRLPHQIFSEAAKASALSV